MIKAILCVVAVLAILWRTLRPGKLRPEQAGWPLAVLAAVSCLAWFNFGYLHGLGAVHHWDQFHYFLGSKYFPEVRYDGLYDASLAAEYELTGTVRQLYVRDLRTNLVAPVSERGSIMEEIRLRFTDDRWRDFRADFQRFMSANNYEYLTKIRLDHGYNPSPTWTFVARIFSRWMPASLAGLTLLAALDPILLAIMFLMIIRTYGTRIGCLSMIIFGLGYPWRYYWVGGAFLRHDWLAAVGIGICLLKQKRSFWAGAFLGYAVMVRIFPLAFLLGLPDVAVHEYFGRGKPLWFVRLACGVMLAVVVGGLAGCMVGTGPRAWADFAGNLSKHGQTWLTNNVGLKNLVLYDRAIVERRYVDFGAPEPWVTCQDRMAERERRLHWLIFAIRAVFLSLTVVAIRHHRPDEAAVTGGIAIAFTMTALTCYYWVMLALLPLARGKWLLSAGWLIINLGLMLLGSATQSYEMLYGAMSWALAGLLLVWLIRDSAGGEEVLPATAVDSAA